MKKIIFILLFVVGLSFIIKTTFASGPERINPVCISSHLNWGGVNYKKQIDLMASGGIRYTRFDFNWSQLEYAPDAWNFTLYDNIVNYATLKGVRVMAMIPQWGIPTFYGGNSTKTAMSPEQYSRLVNKIVEHFKGKIIFYELGNETNLEQFWVSPSASKYASLLKAGYTSAKQADPDSKIITAGIAPVGDWQGYLRTMYQNGIIGYYDYLGFHPYSLPQGPDDSSRGFINLDKARSVANEFGVTPQIMATEVGWSTYKKGVTEAVQAKYIKRVFDKITGENYQYVSIACIYDFVDDGKDRNSSEDNFGVLKNDYKAKPSYQTIINFSNYFKNNFTEIWQ